MEMYYTQRYSDYDKPYKSKFNRRLINGKVKQFSGLTLGTIDTGGITATDTEKTMIQKAFAAGVYL